MGKLFLTELAKAYHYDHSKSIACMIVCDVAERITNYEKRTKFWEDWQKAKEENKPSWVRE